MCDVKDRSLSRELSNHYADRSLCRSFITPFIYYAVHLLRRSFITPFILLFRAPVKTQPFHYCPLVHMWHIIVCIRDLTWALRKRLSWTIPSPFYQ